MRLTLWQCLLAAAAVDLVGFGLILLGHAEWACIAFGGAAGFLLGILVLHWRDF